MMQKTLNLSIKYAAKKVNLSYKELAVQIILRTKDTDSGEASSEAVSLASALKLVASGEAKVSTNSETKRNLSKVTTSLFKEVPFGPRVKLNSEVKKLESEKGEELTWLEKCDLYIVATGSKWHKAGVRI
ncbi:hypothetical protein OH460_09105 [Vibrio sp. Makdt]|uniref:hypothetical protein n=1 Tax=Vibrio sp. Makdt TaxID=2998828 RepID=UPI0022CD4B9F|nr:hypothetical protein [Vibrio sp. Makdt]MDA0152460.1 hypothetical protein [Vibrio sp. Makdt]